MDRNISNRHYQDLLTANIRACGGVDLMAAAHQRLLGFDTELPDNPVETLDRVVQRVKCDVPKIDGTGRICSNTGRYLLGATGSPFGVGFMCQDHADQAKAILRLFPTVDLHKCCQAAHPDLVGRVHVALVLEHLMRNATR